MYRSALSDYYYYYYYYYYCCCCCCCCCYYYFILYRAISCVRHTARAQASMNPPLRRRTEIFPEFSDDLFLVVTLNCLTTLFVVTLHRVYLYRPHYQALSGVHIIV